jgi:hypothetical protein
VAAGDGGGACGCGRCCGFSVDLTSNNPHKKLEKLKKKRKKEGNNKEEMEKKKT